MIIALGGYASSGKDTVANIIQYLICLNNNSLREDQKDFKEFKQSPISNFRQSGWQIKKFANKIKDIVCILLGCNKSDLENREFKEKELGEEWNMWKVVDVNTEEVKYFSNIDKAYDYYEVAGIEEPVDSPITVRLMMQLIGTDVFRDNFNKNIWVNSLMNEYKPTYIFHTDNPNNTTKDNSFLQDVEYPNWIISDMRFPNEMKAVKDKQGITIRVNRETELQNKQLHESETSLDNATFDYVIDNNGSIEELIESVKEILIKENII